MPRRLALHAATLLMDVHLAARQPDRAAAVLLSLEKACDAGLLGSMAPDAGSSSEASTLGQTTNNTGALSQGVPDTDGVAGASGTMQGLQAGCSGQAAAGGCSAGCTALALPAVTNWGSSVMQQARVLMAQQGEVCDHLPSFYIASRLFCHAARFLLCQRGPAGILAFRYDKPVCSLCGLLRAARVLCACAFCADMHSGSRALRLCTHLINMRDSTHDVRRLWRPQTAAQSSSSTAQSCCWLAVQPWPRAMKCARSPRRCAFCTTFCPCCAGISGECRWVY